MTSLSPATVVCLALGLVVAINGLLVLGLTRGSPHRQLEMLRAAGRVAQSPWKKEDDALGELRRQVAQLSEDHTGDPG